MKYDDLITMLSEYKLCKARCLFLSCKINELEIMIENKKRNIINDEVSISQVITGMPHGTDVSSPVENLALKVADGYLSNDIIELQRKYKKMINELENGKSIISYVEACILGLSTKEKTVVELFFFEKFTWREIQDYFTAKNNEYLSKSTLRRIKNDAINKIVSILI